MGQSDGQSIEVNRPLLLGGLVLISVGALIGTVGGIATTVAVIGAARSWVGQLDEPPSATARRRLAQARAAAIAGAQGWRQSERPGVGRALARARPPGSRRLIEPPAPRTGSRSATTWSIQLTLDGKTQRRRGGPGGDVIAERIS